MGRWGRGGGGVESEEENVTSLQFVKCMRSFDIYSGISPFVGDNLVD